MHKISASQQAVRAVLIDIERGLLAERISDDLAQTAVIAVAEALNNIVEHAYGPDMPGDIEVRVAASDAAILCEIRDQGRAMPAGPLPGDCFPEIDPADLDNLPEGGFGWAMLQNIASDLRYTRHENENVLRFEIVA